MSSLDEDLGRLISMMNPYTNGESGTMDPHMFIDAKAQPVGENLEIKDVWMEIDSNYPASWTFKGQEQKVNTALRIGYRWKKTVGTKVVWMTDYLLVGFEGSGGS
ncbi:MAG TPA: hypothetical protein VL985_03655 [Stellaceae bacterium]|nr:hypothetical protein [Stellaceae bacterium]